MILAFWIDYKSFTINNLRIVADSSKAIMRALRANLAQTLKFFIPVSRKSILPS